MRRNQNFVGSVTGHRVRRIDWIGTVHCPWSQSTDHLWPVFIFANVQRSEAQSAEHLQKSLSKSDIAWDYAEIFCHLSPFLEVTSALRYLCSVRLYGDVLPLCCQTEFVVRRQGNVNTSRNERFWLDMGNFPVESWGHPWRKVDVWFGVACSWLTHGFNGKDVGCISEAHAPCILSWSWYFIWENQNENPMQR